MKIAGWRVGESMGADPLREGEHERKMEIKKREVREGAVCQRRRCGRGPAGPSGGPVIGLGFYT